MKFMIKKLIKFILAGLSNTIFSYIIYLVLLIFFNYLISYLISIFLSIIYAYKINTKFVFEVNSRSRYKSLFFVIYTIQILANIFLLKLSIDVFMLSKYIAPLLNIVIVSPITFVTCHYLNNYLKHSEKYLK